MNRDEEAWEDTLSRWRSFIGIGGLLLLAALCVGASLSLDDCEGGCVAPGLITGVRVSGSVVGALLIAAAAVRIRLRVASTASRSALGLARGLTLLGLTGFAGWLVFYFLVSSAH